jgi:hypothetical protein
VLPLYLEFPNIIFLFWYGFLIHLLFYASVNAESIGRGQVFLSFDFGSSYLELGLLCFRLLGVQIIWAVLFGYAGFCSSISQFSVVVKINFR